MNSGQIEMALKKTELQPPISRVSLPETLFLKILRKDSTSSTLIGMVNPEATGYVCKLGNRATVTSTATGKRYLSSWRPISTVFLGTRIERNSKQLQSEFSTTCGQWCMYFVWRKCMGWNMKNITSPFKSEMPLTNDNVMNNLVKKTFGTDKDVIDRSFLKQQICKQMNENIAEWAKIL